MIGITPKYDCPEVKAVIERATIDKPKIRAVGIQGAMVLCPETFLKDPEEFKKIVAILADPNNEHMDSPMPTAMPTAMRKSRKPGMKISPQDLDWFIGATLDAIVETKPDDVPELNRQLGFCEALLEMIQLSLRSDSD